MPCHSIEFHFLYPRQADFFNQLPWTSKTIVCSLLAHGPLNVSQLLDLQLVFLQLMWKGNDS